MSYIAFIPKSLSPKKSVLINKINSNYIIANNKISYKNI